MRVLLALLTTAIAGADFTLQAQTSVPCAAPVGIAPAPTVTGAVQTVTVSWATVRGAAGYTVIRKNPDATCWNLTPQGTTATSFQDAMVPGGNYAYQVGVRSITGQNGLSQWVPHTVMPSPTTTPLPVTLEPAPTTSLTPMNDGPPPAYLNVTGTPTTASLTWAPVTGAVNYGVNRELALVSSNVTLLTTTTATTFNDVLPDPTQTYRYRVQAYQSNGHFGEAAATYKAPPPTNPTGLTGTASGTTVTLSWQPVQYAARYLVSGPGISGTPVTATTHSITAAPVGSNVYKVGSVFDPGALSTSSSLFSSVTVQVYAPVASCGCTSTGDFLEPSFKQVDPNVSASSGSFPSPAGSFTVTVTGTSIEVTDPSGRSVFSQSLLPAAWGYSPTGGHFFLATKPQSPGGPSDVSVYPVKAGPQKWKPAVSTSLAADGFWGFSNDGSMFITTRYVQARFIAQAYNLLASTPQSAVLNIDETNAFAAFVRTSPCGDRVWFWHPAVGEGHFYRRTIFPAKTPEVVTDSDGSGQVPNSTIVSPATNVFVVQLTSHKARPGATSTFSSLQCTP